jgi:undecaprenyl-phosphate 4-deoxy-4-formamido-L-arabinose transferase
MSAEPHSKPAAGHPTVSVVVPVYNSEGSLAALVERLAPVLERAASRYEVILVNDGSRDGSWDVIADLSRRRPHVRGIRFMRNYGQHNALLAGIRAARHDVVVTMDDDLQHPPEEIPALLARLAEGFDVVYGVPVHMPHSAWRNFASWLTKRVVSHVMGIPSIRDISAFRAFRTSLRLAFAEYHSPDIVLDVLLSWGTSRFAAVQVQHHARAVGGSNYTFFQLLGRTMLVLTGFSTGPLRLASMAGFGFTVFGIGVLAYVLIRYFREGSIPGFPFTASIISIFSGVQLFALGIFGEYLARIFKRSLDRPEYVVDADTGSGGS